MDFASASTVVYIALERVQIVYMPNMISLCCGTVPKTIFYHDRDIFDLFRIGCNGDEMTAAAALTAFLILLIFLIHWPLAALENLRTCGAVIVPSLFVFAVLG